jgi:hypothetical protein
MLMEKGGDGDEGVAGRYAPHPLPPQLRGPVRRECNKRKEKKRKEKKREECETLSDPLAERISCKGTGHCRRKTNEQGTPVAVCPSLESLPSCPTTGSAPKAAIKRGPRCEVSPFLYSFLISSHHVF